MDPFIFDSSKVLGSYISGLVVVCILYLFTRKKGIATTSIPLQEVVADFWFNHFLIRKIASFIYFLSLSGFVGTIFLGVAIEGEGSQSVLWIGLSFAFLVLVRLLLELVIAVIKIAENTSLIAEKQ